MSEGTNIAIAIGIIIIIGMVSASVTTAFSDTTIDDVVLTPPLVQ